MAEAKVACRTPAEGRDGVTNVPAWKFDLLRTAILDSLAQRDIAFADLKDAVRERVTADDLARLGSLGWHVTTVKLEMEVRGEIERVAGVTPQVVRLSRPEGEQS